MALMLMSAAVARTSLRRLVIAKFMNCQLTETSFEMGSVKLNYWVYTSSENKFRKSLKQRITSVGARELAISTAFLGRVESFCRAQVARAWLSARILASR